MLNHRTGHTVKYYPNKDRNASREDFPIASTCFPNISYYANVANGQVETDANGAPIVKAYSTKAEAFIQQFLYTPGIGLNWVNDQIAELEALPSPTEMEAFQLQQLKAYKVELSAIVGLVEASSIVAIYNSLREKYSFLNIPGYVYIDPAFLQKGITFTFALLKGNIAYFYVSGFSMSSYLEDEKAQLTFNLSYPETQYYCQQMREVWEAWFNTVQQLHKNGTLGGVILDVRGNMGGLTDDFQYFVGSLLPAGGQHAGYYRFKRGTGRYDYSTLMENRVRTMSTAHETITEPVAILTNCITVSMAEMSTLGVKTMPNGKVIGKRTWGGLCSLIGNEYNTYNYNGFIGEQGVTPVFGYVPTIADFTLDKKLIEGVGIEPDIDVALDKDLFQTTGQDIQLDRAIQYIRSGR